MSLEWGWIISTHLPISPSRTFSPVVSTAVLVYKRHEKRTMRSWAALSMAIFGLSACRTFSDIEPTARPEPRAVKLAVVAYKADIDPLARALGRPLGSVWASGNGFAGKGHVLDEARDRAAAYGCTHVTPCRHGKQYGARDHQQWAVFDHGHQLRLRVECDHLLQRANEDARQ